MPLCGIESTIICFARVRSFVRWTRARTWATTNRTSASEGSKYTSGVTRHRRRKVLASGQAFASSNTLTQSSVFWRASARPELVSAASSSSASVAAVGCCGGNLRLGASAPLLRSTDQRRHLDPKCVSSDSRASPDQEQQFESYLTSKTNCQHKHIKKCGTPSCAPTVCQQTHATYQTQAPLAVAKHPTFQYLTCWGESSTVERFDSDKISAHSRS